jgi:hypothetical protein
VFQSRNYRAGQAFGHIVALILPLVAYAMIIGYLMLPQTRREFSENHEQRMAT